MTSFPHSSNHYTTSSRTYTGAPPQYPAPNQNPDTRPSPVGPNGPAVAGTWQYNVSDVTSYGSVYAEPERELTHNYLTTVPEYPQGGSQYQPGFASTHLPAASSAYSPTYSATPDGAYIQRHAYAGAHMSVSNAHAHPASMFRGTHSQPGGLSALQNHATSSQAGATAPYAAPTQGFAMHPHTDVTGFRSDDYGAAENRTRHHTREEAESSRSSSMLHSSRPRNVQVPSHSHAHSYLSASSSSQPLAPSPPADQWKCPYCPHVQHNHRLPDFKRHVATHKRAADAPLWICCGVPLVNARELGVPTDVIRSSSAVEFAGVPMVGGCWTTFSRRDALQRHLKREEGTCFGDALSLYQPGNRLGVDFGEE